MVDVDNVPTHQHLKYGDINLKLSHQIARGGYSTVFKATDIFDNPLVVKMFTREANPLMWRNELTNYQCLSHPQIVHMYGAFEIDKQGYLILEDGGISVGRINLSDAHERLLVFTLTAKCMLQALHFMHNKNFVHTDINPANALIKLSADNKPQTVKLCDLGLTLKENALSPGKHKAKWNPPPAAIDQKRFGNESRKMDIYSTALVLMELLRGEELGRFDEDEIFSAAPQQMAAELPFAVAADLALALHVNQEKRPSALELWKILRKTSYRELNAHNK